MENSWLNLVVKKNLWDFWKKGIFEKLDNERIDELQNLSKRFNFDNLVYYFKGKSRPENFIGFKDSLAFYKNIKDGYTTLEKAEKKQKTFKLDINEMIKGGEQSEEQNSAMKNIKTLYESREKVIKFFNDYYKIVSEAKHKTKYGEGLKILTPKQML